MKTTLALAALLTAAPALNDANRTWSEGRDSDLFGHSVSNAGDIDMDGFGDVIVGAPGTADDTGRALVYDGHTEKIVHDWKGENPGDLFGWSVSGAGDVDNDGFADLVVGAPGFDEERGKVYVFDGKKGEIFFELEGEDPGDRFGWSVSDAGDVNNDGFGDFIVGAPGKDDKKHGEDAGRAYVYSGKKAKELHEFKPQSASEELGFSVANAGDANIDGFGDVVVGAPGARKKKKEPPVGAVRLYHGKKGKLLHAIFGVEEGDRFGHAVHGAGDCNGNGAADLVIGTDTDASYVKIVDGKKAEELFHLEADREGSGYGWSVASAGDFDGDAFSDVVIGVPDSSPPRVLVVSGKTGELLREHEGDGDDSRYGVSVSSAGDLNADSFAEIIVGANGDGASKGKAIVHDAKD